MFIGSKIMSIGKNLSPNDWFEHPELLPPRPLSLTETKYTRRFAIDIRGVPCHDQYVFLSPNRLAVIGLAPSHPLVAAHRRETGYQPTPLTYIPPNLTHFKPEDLVSAAGDEDGPEDAEVAASGRLESRNGAAAAEGSHTSHGSGAAGPKSNADGRTSPDAEQEDAAGGDGGGARTAGGSGGSSGGGVAVRGGVFSGRPPLPECEPFTAAECSRINFEEGAARNQIGTKVSGKKRGRGGPQQLFGGSVLAKVERQGGGSSFPIWSPLKGQLLEINERLIRTPSLLFDRPCREGYVAILLPTPDAIKYFETKMISEVEYLQLRGLTAEDLL